MISPLSLHELPRRVPRRARALAVVLVVATVIAAACGSTDSSPAPSGTAQAATSAPDPSSPGVTAPASPAPVSPAVSPAVQVPDATPSPEPTLPPALASGFRVHAYDLRSLAMGNRAYADSGGAPLAVDYPADARGVPVYTRHGKHYLHPVSAAQQGIRQLVTFLSTRKPVYLRRARAIADALIAAGVHRDGALWIPYRFDFALHGLAGDTMKAPWYSAMAQGQVLTLVSRLYEVTGKPQYLDDANAVFASFTVVGRRAAPWVSWVESNYLWLEEYPGSPPDHTLNGFNFALFGIYDYFEITQSAEAERVFQGGLTTIRRYLPKFRNPGHISFYCLLHHELSAKYHHIHEAQLRELTRMTGDPYFAHMADLLQADHG